MNDSKVDFAKFRLSGEIPLEKFRGEIDLVFFSHVGGLYEAKDNGTVWLSDDRRDVDGNRYAYLHRLKGKELRAWLGYLYPDEYYKGFPVVNERVYATSEAFREDFFNARSKNGVRRKIFMGLSDKQVENKEEK